MENIKRQSKISSEAAICRCSTKETPAQVFSCEYCEMFKNSFFYRTPAMGAFVNYNIKASFMAKVFQQAKFFRISIAS